MLLESVSAPAPDLLASFAAHAAARGLRGRGQRDAAVRFLRRWPVLAAWRAEPLELRLAMDKHSGAFLTFLMLDGHLHPGYEYLVRRKLPKFWRALAGTRLEADMERFLAAAAEVGFTARTRSAIASQVIGRILIETGRPLTAISDVDLDALALACRARERSTGRATRHYHVAIHGARAVLYHLGILATPPSNALARFRQSFAVRMQGVPATLRPTFVRYLDHQVGTHARATVTGMATRLAVFGRFLATVDPGLGSLRELDRCRHIEPYLAAVAAARSSRRGTPLSPVERRGRILAVSCFLRDIAEWGWPEAPERRLLFRGDVPKLPRPLPRYLAPDADRRLASALERSADRLAADALLLQRATGLRIGELVSLELDCVHEIPGQGAWLKVPLGKLDSERMVPLDQETVALVDRIAAHRSPGRPLPHPRTGRPTEFLLTHHGRRLSVEALRDTLTRAAAAAGLEHVTPHQLRHTYATALVNAGVSLQSLMALLGHVSAEMSLRYGRLFDSTVRTEYERALTLAKERLGPLLPETAPLPLTD
ncbi:MAG TPA: tyrosine-type recombinase/integrase, partial [Burkholderiales bacterium]|nr:tyrosine-type recombinase/integrase [Burkholderiales bacterium]